jgi:hypothetical protein
MFAVTLLAGVTAAGSVFVVLSGGQSPLSFVGPGVAVVVLAGVGYFGYRTAIGRFASPPCHAASDESRDDSGRGPTSSDGEPVFRVPSSRRTTD